MLANKIPESQHRLETSSRHQEQASQFLSLRSGKPLRDIYLPTVFEMLMAHPRALLFCLLFLVIAEGWGRQAAIPGCHLHPFNVTVRSDRQGTCQGSHVAQACVGHCESSAFPSRYSVLVASGYRHNITSISQCCTISGLRKVRGPSPMVGGDRGDGSKMAQGRGLEHGSPSPTGEGAVAVWGRPEGGAGDLHSQGLPV
ncbi:glycoprotein hormone alpha-2 isoform 2-T2 [Molossus nigricans]